VAKQTTSTPADRTGTRALGRLRAGGTGTRSGGTPAPASRRAPASPVSFFQESRAELRKVTWPTRQEATNLTIAVIGMTVGIAAFLGLIDGTLDRIIKPLIGG
jgi:preprotein translocase subunit SecE